VSAQNRVMRLVREPSRIGPAVRRRLPGGRRVEPHLPATAASVPPRNGPPADLAERRRIMTASIDLDGLGLEIGPSHRPLLPKREGFNIRTADHLDQAGLIAKYDGIRETSGIEFVDYVVQGNRLTTTIPDTFDYVVASHVIEHTVCLVSFLQDVRKLLNPGGVLSLAVPDRRYSFDRFRERSSLARVLEIYHAAPEVHSEGAIIDYFFNVVRKGSSISWFEGAPGEYQNVHTFDQAMLASATVRDGEYVDVHNWVFTPSHFRVLIEDLFTLGLIDLREKSFGDTRGSEFFVTLGVDGEGPGLTRHELLERSADEIHDVDSPRFADDGPVSPR